MRLDAKWISVNDQLVAYVLNGQLEWTMVAASMLSVEERQVAKAWAEGA